MVTFVLLDAGRPTKVQATLDGDRVWISPTTPTRCRSTAARKYCWQRGLRGEAVATTCQGGRRYTRSCTPRGWW